MSAARLGFRSLAGDRHRILEVRVESGDIRACGRREAFPSTSRRAGSRVRTGRPCRRALRRGSVRARRSRRCPALARRRGRVSEAHWVRPKSARYAVLAAVLLVDEDVRRLDVAMDEAAARGRRRAHRRPVRRSRAPARIERAFATQQRLQVGPVDEAHRDEQAPVCLARLVDRDHVRVVEPRREPRLAQQPLAEAVVVGERRQRAASAQPGARGSDRGPGRPRPCRRGRGDPRSRIRPPVPRQHATRRATGLSLVSTTHRSRARWKILEGW